MSCPECKCLAYSILAMGLYDDESYFQKRTCQKCLKPYYEVLPLRNSSKWLHHHVYQWMTGFIISRGTIILRLNGNKRDNRPCNLKWSSSTRIGPDALQIRTAELQSEVRRLEARIKELTTE